jgi:hypothetical protein
MKKYLFVFLIFFQTLARPQNQLLKSGQNIFTTPDSLPFFQIPSARDSVFSRAEIGIKQLAKFSCRTDTTITVQGNSQKFGYIPERMPEIIGLINGTKKFRLQVEQLDSAFFSYRDTLNNLWGRFLVSHQPGVIVLYSEGKHQPKKNFVKGRFKRLTVKVATLVGLLEFPVSGQAFLIITYVQKGDSVKNNFQIYLETGHQLANDFADNLIKTQYKTVAGKAIGVTLEKMLKKTASDSLALPPSSSPALR